MFRFLKSLLHIDLGRRLSSLHAIERAKDAEADFDWLSKGRDPQFLIKGRGLGSGWYMLEIDLRHDQPSADAKIYFDHGSGFNEPDSVFIPIKSGRVTKRLVYLSSRAHALRFDPMETSGLFSIRHFHLVRLPAQFAYDRLSQRLANMHFKFRDLGKANVLQYIREEARETNRPWKELALHHYARTFTKRRQTCDYAEWIGKVEAIKLASRSDDAYGEKLDAQPLISIILPTFNTDPELLRDCLESVLAQSYNKWQLCIADDASSNQKTRECLLEYQAQDSRIQVVFRKDNGHISAASNTALELVKGGYIALLDHDDTLAPHALMTMVKAIADNPQAQLLYSDEDKIDELGERFDPHFKPGWNPDLLLSQNYICHLTVLKTALVEQIGGFRLGLEGSQDHDLLLRCVPYLNSDNVVHIPEILYHWRAISGSTALEGGAKNYAATAGLKAVNDYLSSQTINATAMPGTAPNSYRVRWNVPESAPLVSLLVPTRDGFGILKPCVEAILSRTDYPNFELLILDNQSTCEATLSFLEEICTSDPRVSVHRWDYPFNYSAINNFGAGLAKGEVIGLINNDIEPINSDWLSELVGQALRPEIGCVGAKLYYPNDTIQHGGVILGIGGVAGHSHKYFSRNEYGYFSRLHLIQNLSAVTAACLLLRKAVFDEVGGLNEEDLAVSFNDVDLCLKVREAGYRNLWTPYAELYHHESVSRGADNTTAKRRRAQREADYMRGRWGDLLDTDPAYNPNLTLIHEDFTLA
ncbi:glycosyltransferase family 2 protein [Microbulbifer sp. A4B17]|uniref:glycosyltransferase family 2 protein n=1 Tax=Microbulbifer sp. A4B17 TaxID=359370 RepID=UPI000D52CF45|nr:glycosyltransferase family 2 protein [Microbulbifer sp. A4B17]AWF80108.1 glycosyltransferase family 2 protein [Microbulbifer sp. A4B17]